MSKLTWSGYQSWYNTNNQPITVNNLVAGYIKSYQNLSFYTIFGAGHMVRVLDERYLTLIIMLLTVTTGALWSTPNCFDHVANRDQQQQVGLTNKF